MSIATLDPPPPTIEAVPSLPAAPITLATPTTLRVVRPDGDDDDTPLSGLHSAAVRAGNRWINAVAREARARIEAPRYAGVFAHTTDRAASRFQAAINELHADGPEGAASQVHFEAHMMAREAWATAAAEKGVAR